MPDFGFAKDYERCRHEIGSALAFGPMKSSNPRALGELVAGFLAGSWRAKQPPVDISPSDLELITALLYNSGGAGLAWWRIRASGLKTSPCGELLHQGYRLQALQTPINEGRIATAFCLLRAAGIEPILVKGWSTARFYPHQTLRAYGDIDLLVRPAEYGAARDALQQDEAGAWWVDLHPGLSEVADRPLEALFERSRTVALNDLRVRVLSDEDHLAHSAVHLFKHSAWRPSMLCDIAAMVEALPADFDQSICFGSNKRQAAWIAAAIVLAEKLLGADVERTQLSQQARDLPEWLIDSALKQWGNLLRLDHLPVQPRPLFVRALRSPRMMWKEIWERWPDPIFATYNLRGQPNNFPRLPYQLGFFAINAGQYLFRMRRMVGDL